jgi:hypothetical protein
VADPRDVVAPLMVAVALAVVGEGCSWNKDRGCG